MDNSDGQMLYISFNQDNSAFSVGTENGFRIYNSFPYRDFYERNLEGGIGIVEMLYKSNILALVGGGKYPKFSRNKVIIWDDYQAKTIAELSFTTYIKNIKMKKDRIIVVCDTKIYIFNLVNFQNIETIDTFENTKGIIAITFQPSINLVAFPDKANGYVNLKNLDKNETLLINAHNSKIAFLSLSSNGVFLGTVSDKGRYIRIFNSEKGIFLNEFTMDSECEIWNITFDMEVEFFCVNSSSGDIRIFSLKSSYEKMRQLPNEELKQKKISDKKNEIIVNREIKSFWGKLNIFGSESQSHIAEFTIPESKSISAFVSNNTFVVVSSEGRYYVATFNPKKEERCAKIEELSLNLNNNL